MRWLVAIALTAGCGDDGLAPETCGPEGYADVVGTIGGAALGPFVRASQIETGSATAPRHALVFDEIAGGCGELAITGKHLVLLMCEPPEPKNYRVVPEPAFRCPGNEVLALVEQDGAIDTAESTSGALRIEHVGGCVAGTYELQLGLDTLEGSFDAVVCD